MTEDKVHEIVEALERKANVELQRATAYHNGYIQACEDFGRAIRQELLDVGEDELTCRN